jgi:hypothetical protein
MIASPKGDARMKRLIAVLVPAAAAVAVAGCFEDQQRDAAVGMPLAAPAARSPGAPSPYLEKIAVEPPETDERDVPPAVESALVWSERYARTVEDLAAEQRRNHELADQARKLMGQVAQLKAELDRTQRELADANDLLVTHRREIEKWKTDVLGFRDEMRGAHQVELEALLKVMKLLGAETPEPTAAASGPVPAPEAPAPGSRS